MEKRDLYDRNKNLTGETIYKGEPIPADRYIIVVMVFIQNSERKFLIQKRSKEKDGLYGATGGHPKAGETSLQGIITEIQEEIGLEVAENEIELIYEGREDTERVFFNIYYLKKDFDINTLNLQKEEVEFVEWLTIPEIKQLIAGGVFKKTHAEEVYRLIDIFRKRGIELE